MSKSTTIRIPKKKTIHPKSEIIFSNNIRLGCEFEFYINGNSYDDIVKELERISGSDILINLDFIMQ